MESVCIKLPEDLVTRLHRVAADDDVSVGQIVRAAIEQAFLRRDSLSHVPRTADTLLAPIRAQLRADFIEAKGWGDLRTRLIAKRYILRESGAGLALHDAISGRFLCSTSELGFGYLALMRQFEAPFPGHSQTELLERIKAMPVHLSR
jgi:hypothetical protein